jgi:hypothetical protein
LREITLASRPDHGTWFISTDAQLRKFIIAGAENDFIRESEKRIRG